MQHVLRRLVFALLLVGVAVGPVFAQGGATSSITGVVADSGGGVIPGATVAVANAQGVSVTVVTGADGSFTVPSLVPGTYKVTVTLQGFKTAVIADIQVAANAPRQVKAVLEVGNLSETITVASSAELVNTQTATVSSTLNADQLNRMPTPTR